MAGLASKTALGQVQQAVMLHNSHPSTVLAHLGKKWAPAIIRELQSGEKRYFELRSAIHGISEKMLAQTLRELERDGLVSRTSYPMIPPHVVYALTTLGTACAYHLALLVDCIESRTAV